jgi:D-glycero-D-manno-heptose 1,7-bisphosphate phosphatase
LTVAATRLVLVDRDGVINRDSDNYIKSVTEWEPLPGSLEAIRDLSEAGFRVVVITNQSGIGRGLFTEQTLAEIHREMENAVAAAGGKIAAIYCCPHRPDAGCDCRKPSPGLLQQAARDFGVSLDGIAFIGDKLTDIEAARRANARPVLVGDAVSGRVPDDIERYADLAAAARVLILESGAA